MADMKPERASSSWVTRFAHLAPAGLPVLDIACGGGRHTRYFARRGYAVTAVDIDLSSFTPGDAASRVTAVKRDLEDGMIWQFGTQTFGTVVVTNYLHRPLLPSLIATVAFGGVLIYETFAEGHGAYGSPTNPDYLLKPGELIDAVRGKLQIVAYENGYCSRPRRSVRQRICAVNGHLPVSLTETKR